MANESWNQIIVNHTQIAKNQTELKTVIKLTMAKQCPKLNSITNEVYYVSKIYLIRTLIIIEN